MLYNIFLVPVLLKFWYLSLCFYATLRTSGLETFFRSSCNQGFSVKNATSVQGNTRLTYKYGNKHRWYYKDILFHFSSPLCTMQTGTRVKLGFMLVSEWYKQRTHTFQSLYNYLTKNDVYLPWIGSIHYDLIIHTMAWHFRKEIQKNIKIIF